jgi:hypothetical protein
MVGRRSQARWSHPTYRNPKFEARNTKQAQRREAKSFKQDARFQPDSGTFVVSRVSCFDEWWAGARKLAGPTLRQIQMSRLALGTMTGMPIDGLAGIDFALLRSMVRSKTGSPGSRNTPMCPPLIPARSEAF